MGIVKKNLPEDIFTDFKLILKGVFGTKYSRMDSIIP